MLHNVLVEIRRQSVKNMLLHLRHRGHHRQLTLASRTPKNEVGKLAHVTKPPSMGSSGLFLSLSFILASLLMCCCKTGQSKSAHHSSFLVQTAGEGEGKGVSTKIANGAHRRPLVPGTKHTLLFLARSELIQFSAQIGLNSYCII